MNNPSFSIVDLNSAAYSRASFLKLACPSCGGVIGGSQNKSLSCTSCHRVLKNDNGIYRALRPDRESYFSQFISDYAAIRHAEGRGSLKADYYLALPFHDLSGRLNSQWKIRAQSFQTLERRVLRPIAEKNPAGIDVLDVGAGNGWLSYQLAKRGHRPVAVDILLDDKDGLGSASHFFRQLGWVFPRFQAEMDCLPFADAQFDLVVFNAALHYSTHPFTTLREALRCLRQDGHLLIVDSPIYYDEQSGLLMREERHQQFFKDYGFRSDAVPSIEFLTYKMIEELGNQLALEWRLIRPWYGISWALRPLRAKWHGRREPSKFNILQGKRRHS
jgi:ubiquinone/menaquinone biosynthesis C-methylase UbiE